MLMSEECCLNGTAFLLNAFIVSMLHISMAKDAARPHETTETLAPKTCEGIFFRDNKPPAHQIPFLIIILPHGSRPAITELDVTPSLIDHQSHGLSSAEQRVSAEDVANAVLSRRQDG